MNAGASEPSSLRRMQTAAPEAWAKPLLGEVGVLFCGQSPPSSAVNGDAEGTPYVTGPDQWDGHRLRLDKWTTDPRRIVPDGCLFVTVKGAGVGTVFPGTACAIGRDIYAYKPEAGFSVRFMEHALRFTIGEVVRLAAGDIPGLSKAHILKHAVWLPPAAEQDRIVAEVERHLTRLDAAVGALEQVRANLKRYRAAVLNAACEGRLVPTEAELAQREGRSYETADQLLARILDERRMPWEKRRLPATQSRGKTRSKATYEEPMAADATDLPPVPEGWTLASMDQITSHITSGSRDWSKYYGKGSATFLMAQNVRSGHLDLSHRQVVDPPLKNSDRIRSQVTSGDLLVTIVGANTGDVCRVPRELPEHFVCQSVALMRPVRVETSRFVEAYMISPENGQRQYSRYIYGAGRPHLSFEQLRTTPVLLPPLAEQHRIVAEVDRRLSVSDELATLVGTNLKRAERLRQAILKRAFEGRLVPQDPNDEPASVLLERIRADRAAAAAKSHDGGRQRTIQRQPSRRKHSQGRKSFAGA